MNISDILAFAKAKGYVDAEPTDSWRGYDVYMPIWGYESHYDSGLPFFILVKGNEIRMSTVKETEEWLDG